MHTLSLSPHTTLIYTIKFKELRFVLSFVHSKCTWMHFVCVCVRRMCNETSFIHTQAHRTIARNRTNVFGMMSFQVRNPIRIAIVFELRMWSAVLLRQKPMRIIPFIWLFIRLLHNRHHTKTMIINIIIIYITHTHTQQHVAHIAHIQQFAFVGCDSVNHNIISLVYLDASTTNPTIWSMQLVFFSVPKLTKSEPRISIWMHR